MGGMSVLSRIVFAQASASAVPTSPTRRRMFPAIRDNSFWYDKFHPLRDSMWPHGKEGKKIGLSDFCCHKERVRRQNSC
jgi:hypothetical protein